MPTYPPNVTFTSRLALPRPGLDDLADGPDAFNDLTDVLDPVTTVYAQGTLAVRPAAGVAGRLYWATDTRAVYYDDGSAWQSAAGNAAVGAALPVLDVGVAGQIRAGRQLAVVDFTSLGLAQPLGLWNLSDLSNLGSDGRALANKGAVPFGIGINGQAATSAVFAGSASQALYIADSGAADPLRIRAGGSIGYWMRTAKRGIDQIVLSKWGAQGAYQLSVGAANTAGSQWSTTGADAITAVSVTDVADDRWHFVVATNDGTLCRIYIDGLLEGTAVITQPVFASAAPVNIGGRGADAGTATGVPFYGRVDEAFITADVLSEDQIRCLYAARLAHTLGVTPTAVRLNVTRRRKGAAFAVADFATQPIRLHNFTAGALTDQGSGNVALTNNGAALSSAGADGTPGGAYSFAGAQSLSASDAGLPAALAARSYGCWLKTTMAAAQAGILVWGTVSTGDARIILGAPTNGVLGAISGADLITGPYIADGQWHLAVVTEYNAAGAPTDDGVKRKLYVDGHLVGSSIGMASVTLAGANRFRVAANQDGTLPFVGQIDGAFVTGYTMTHSEVLTLYAKGSQSLGVSPKNAGDHVERMDVSSVLFIGDTLDSQSTVDLGVVA